MMAPSRAVFLSYASQDAAAAQRICEALRAGGIEVWFDQSELRGGDLWDASIRRQIRACGLFIPVISRNTHAREEGYFRLEWKLAVDRSHLMAGTRAFLLPVAIDDTRDDDERTPERFREVQWTRLPAGETPPDFVARVARLLSTAADASTSTESPTAKMGRAGPAAARHSRLPVLLIALAVLVGGYLAIDKFLLSERGAAAATRAPAAPAVEPAYPGSTEKSIAVLPFVDMSEKKDQEYFSDGLSEELIDHLAHAAGLKVIARTSSFQFKGKNEDVRTIALKLGVANLLEGSVRTAGHQMRIAAQLVRAADGTDLWSQTYDRQVSDIFQVQDEIAGKVAEALSATLSGRPAGQDRNEKNPAAYDLLLKGNYFYFRNHKGDFERAADYFQQAVALDPKYALAWAQLGRTYIEGSPQPGIGASQAEPKAREALQRALAIDPNSVVAHRWLGRIYLNFRWDWPAAEQELRRAYALDPGGTEGKLALGDVEVLEAFRTGRFDAGIDFAIKELANNPLDTSALWFLSWFSEMAGRHEQAALHVQRLLDLDPDYSGAYGQAAAIALAMGNTNLALADAQKEPDEETRLAVIARIYWKMGRRAEADGALHALEGKFPRDAAYDIAVVHAQRAEIDAALTWLERAYQQHDDNMVGLKVDQRLSAMHGEPRYRALMKRMNFS